MPFSNCCCGTFRIIEHQAGRPGRSADAAGHVAQNQPSSACWRQHDKMLAKIGHLRLRQRRPWIIDRRLGEGPHPGTLGYCAGLARLDASLLFLLRVGSSARRLLREYSRVCLQPSAGASGRTQPLSVGCWAYWMRQANLVISDWPFAMRRPFTACASC